MIYVLVFIWGFCKTQHSRSVKSLLPPRVIVGRQVDADREAYAGTPVFNRGTRLRTDRTLSRGRMPESSGIRGGRNQALLHNTDCVASG